MKMLAPYPRKISVNTLSVLMNDFEVREVSFRSNESKTDICPYCRVVDDTAHYFPVSPPRTPKEFHQGAQKFKKNYETLVSLLHCENKVVISALAGFIASID